jgi:hypothetical protein
MNGFRSKDSNWILYALESLTKVLMSFRYLSNSHFENSSNMITCKVGKRDFAHPEPDAIPTTSRKLSVHPANRVPTRLRPRADST